MSREFRFCDIENIEQEPGVYEIHTDTGLALKVGIGKNLRKRLLQHRASLQSCLKLKQGGKWTNPNDVQSKGSILAKHLYYDLSLTNDYDLKTEAGRRAFLHERCYIVLIKITKTKDEARSIEKQLEKDGKNKYRYVKTFEKRS
jgi:hypothetical protein